MKNLKINIEKNIGYLKTDTKKTKITRTVEIGDDFLVDFNKDGDVVGIELLNPVEQLGIKYKKTYTYPSHLIAQLSNQVKDGK